MVNLVKKYRVILIIVLPVLLLILIRSAGFYHFKSDSKKWAEPSLLHTNTLGIEQVSKLGGKCLIICLDKAAIPEGITGNVMKIASDSILYRNTAKMILKHDGPVLLCSQDPALSARFWMLLSQMGSRNIYILANNSENEVLKYSLHPDSIPDPNVQ